MVAAVAAASGARLEGGAAEGAGPGGPARSSSSSSSAAATELDALFLTAEGWVAGDLARAVRGALEARMRRRRGGREGEKGGGGGGGSGGSGGSGGGNGGQGGEAPPPPPPSPPPSPSAPPPLRGPLTAREIVASLLSGPRPPRASELAAVLDWAGGGRPYPTEQFAECWQDTLFSHFHDILPGSGVHDTRTYTHGQFQNPLCTSASLSS